jgi:formylglycine-generating enzyme required for sulfatase activity
MRCALAWILLGALGACSSSSPTRDEVTIVVDTDAPVPGWVDHLEVELFDGAGTTRLAQRIFALPNPEDWPISFGVHPSSAGEPTSLRVRARAFNTTRPLSPWQRTVLGIVPSEQPESFDPLTTIDRAAQIDVKPGSGPVQVRLLLRGDCFGVASDVAGGRSCVATGALEDIASEPAVAASDPAASPRVGTWAAVIPAPCSAPSRGAGTDAEALCIPGGAFVFGDRWTEGLLPGFEDVQSVPERIVQLSPFFLDRFEVSVARLRAAMKAPTNPFVPPQEPTHPSGAATCSSAIDYRFCTWPGLDAPEDPATDGLPVNCITQETARAFCRWSGGDLPSEAQWEYAATQAYRDIKSALPWGDATPNCGFASYGRFSSAYADAECGRDAVCGPLAAKAPFGAGPPAPHCEGAACTHDETPGPDGRGIVGMAGNVAEWVRDSAIPFTDPCWQSAPRLDPVCEVPSAKAHMYRGGSWLTAAWALVAVFRSGGTSLAPLLAQYGAVGLRCAFPGAGP